MAGPGVRNLQEKGGGDLVKARFGELFLIENHVTEEKSATVSVMASKDAVQPLAEVTHDPARKARKPWPRSPNMTAKRKGNVATVKRPGLTSW